jgi:iron complex transport system permease protein
MLLALRFGDSHVSFADLFRTITGNAPDSLIRNALIDHRLPRILVAGMAGIALAVSGLLVQGVVRNPLAVPSIPAGLLPVAAFAGACVTFAAVYALSWSQGLNPTRLALVGIGASAAAGAITNLIIIRNPMQLTAALTWLSGSTYARSWNHVAQLVPWLLVLLPLAWLSSRWLDLLALGDDLPQTLGMRIDRVRLAILAIAVGLAAAAVSVVGAIGFIGLLAPHLSRMLIAGKHRRLIPFAAIVGATLLIGADVIGRSLMAPNEIPSGLVVAAIGTPYFLWLLWRSRSVRTRR